MKFQVNQVSYGVLWLNSGTLNVQDARFHLLHWLLSYNWFLIVCNQVPPYNQYHYRYKTFIDVKFVSLLFVKKLIQACKLRLAMWNIGTLPGRGWRISDTMIRRSMNIACLQETKPVGKIWINTKYRRYTMIHRKGKHREGVG